MPHKYTPEQDKFLRNNVTGRSVMELTARFNEHFSLDLKYTQVRSAVKSRGLCCGIDCRFNKGQISYNKGKKGNSGWKSTQFKKGSTPHNYKAVGSEVINTDGYTEIKIGDPNKWRHKHIVVWEQHYGLLQKGEVVIFGDGDKSNFDINNLIKISRRELAVLNQRQLITADADLTRSGVLIADIILKISEVKKKRI